MSTTTNTVTIRKGDLVAYRYTRSYHTVDHRKVETETWRIGVVGSATRDGRTRSIMAPDSKAMMCRDATDRTAYDTPTRILLIPGAKDCARFYERMTAMNGGSHEWGFVDHVARDAKKVLGLS